MIDQVGGPCPVQSRPGPQGTNATPHPKMFCKMLYSLDQILEGAVSSKRLEYDKVPPNPGKTGNYPGGSGQWEKLVSLPNLTNQVSSYNMFQVLEVQPLA